MELKHYQNQSRRTAIYPGQNSHTGLLYVVLGLCGESGEIAENIKKMLRDDGGILTQERLEHLTKECGDVLWYISQICFELGISLETVATRNLAKLRKRQRENTLGGSGDDR